MNFKLAIFLFVAFGLTVQCTVIYFQSEPYPAIWAPGFQASRGAKDSYIKPDFRFKYSDGHVESYEIAELLSEYPDSMWGAIVSRLMPITGSDVRPERRLYSVFPGYRKARYGREQQKTNVARWFQKQSVRLNNRVDLAAVEVRWDRYELPGGDHIAVEGIYEVSGIDAE